MTPAKNMFVVEYVVEFREREKSKLRNTIIRGLGGIDPWKSCDIDPLSWLANILLEPD